VGAQLGDGASIPSATPPTASDAGCRGRDTAFAVPPAQIRTGGFPATTDTYEYDAFGNKLSSTGSTPNNYLYRGEQYDPDLGLYCLRARYYNPATGRFLSRDPEDPQPFDSDGYAINPISLHKYLYADGNPVNAQDPTGRGVYEYLFARKIRILNTGALIRLGESWNNNTKCLVFRLVIGSAGVLIHWHWDWWDVNCP
jgi:RHS repeat-associated protein